MPDILWSLTAERDLSRMPAAIRESLITRVELLREYPLLWFTEGFDTKALQEAKARLEELAGC